MNENIVIGGAILILLIGVIIRLVNINKQSSVSDEKRKPPVKKVEEEVKSQDVPKSSAQATSTAQQPSFKELLKQQQTSKKNLKQKKRTNPTHPKFFKGFKGFSDSVTDFDIQNNGNVVVGVSLDKTFRVFKSKDIEDQNPNVLSEKIDFNFATGVSLSQDCKTVAVSLDTEQSVKFYKLTGLGKYDDDDAKIKAELTSEFPKNLHKTTIHSIYLDKMGLFAVTGSEENDTTIKVWSPTGENVNTFNNNQLKNYKFYASEDGKFIGVASWSADCRILEMKRNKDGTFKSLVKAMELKGHRQSLISLGFNHATDQVATISKDNTIKIWNINVNYEMSEDAKCIQTIDVSNYPELSNKNFSLIAMYSNSTSEITKNIIAVAYESNIVLFDLTTEKVIEDIAQAHNEGLNVNKLLFKCIQNVLYLFSAGEDGRINVWKI